MDAVVVAAGDAGDDDDAAGGDAVVQAAGPRRAHKHRRSTPDDSGVYLDVLPALSTSPVQHSSITGSLVLLPPHSRRSPPTLHLVDERVACTHQKAAIRGNDNPVWQHLAERPTRHSHHHCHDLSGHYPRRLAMQQVQQPSSCWV